MNNRPIYKKGLPGAAAAILLIALDQWTKWLAAVHLKGNPPIELISGIFELKYLENRGAAFGILQNQKALLVIFTAIILVGIVYIYLKKIPSEKRYFSLDAVTVLFFAGAIGNLIDRILQDYVVDFFYFVFIDFPIFNVADIYVTIAAFLMIILGFFYYKEEDFERILPSKKKDSKHYEP